MFGEFIRVAVPSAGEKYVPDVLLSSSPFKYRLLSSIDVEIVKLYPALQVVVTLISSSLIDVPVVPSFLGIMSIILTPEEVMLIESADTESTLMRDNDDATPSRQTRIVLLKILDIFILFFMYV